MRRRQCHGWVMLAAIALLIAACGQADPSFAPAGAADASPAQSASSTASATPTTSPVNTTMLYGTPAPSQGHAVDWINLPADFTVRTATKAESMAAEVAGGMLGGQHPHVASVWLVTRREAEQANGSVDGQNEDPLALIWWVNFDSDRYVIPMCPYMPGPGGTPQPCGSSSYASADVVARTGEQPDLGVGSNYTPTAVAGDLTLPSTAKLRTEGEAIAAALQDTPGVGASVPQVVGVRLLTAQQFTDERGGGIVMPGMAPDLPLWAVELTNANIVIPCLRLEWSACVPQPTDVLFNALTGDFSGVFSPPLASATPAP